MDKRSEPTDRQKERDPHRDLRIPGLERPSAKDPKDGLPKKGETKEDLSEQETATEETKKKDKGYVRAFANYSQIAFTVAAVLLISVFIGRFLDRLLGTSPWLLLVLSILGLGAALKSVFNISQ